VPAATSVLLAGHGTAPSVLLQRPSETSPPSIVAAVAVSTTIGVLFGFGPAWNASRLDPIDALRYE